MLGPRVIETSGLGVQEVGGHSQSLSYQMGPTGKEVATLKFPTLTLLKEWRQGAQMSIVIQSLLLLFSPLSYYPIPHFTPACHLLDRVKLCQRNVL